MGPLPKIYTILIVVVVLGLCMGAGVWLTRYLNLPLGGVGVGLAAGAFLAFLLTRDSRRQSTR